MDEQHWNILSAEESLGKPQSMRTSRFKEWQESLSIGNPVKVKKVGLDEFWYIFTLEDAIKLFDSVEDLKTIYMSNDNIKELQEGNSLILSDVSGESIVVKMK